MYRIQPLTSAELRDMMTWRYAPPYDYYDPPRIDEASEPLWKDPASEFFGIRDVDYRFVGFCSFGLDGRVLGGHYEAGPLDIGLGMKPNMTGRGLGKGFFNAILVFAQEEFNTGWLRLTVADFNRRAMCLYESCGFEATGHFLDAEAAKSYTIMERKQTSGF